MTQFAKTSSMFIFVCTETKKNYNIKTTYYWMLTSTAPWSVLPWS